jgi:hypothetical protein
MKKLVLLTIGLLTAGFSLGQNFGWVKSASWSESDICDDLCTDEQGNIYAAGHFWSLSREPKPAGNFIRKYNSLGDIIVSKVFYWDTTFRCMLESIYADKLGDFYVSGRFEGKLSIEGKIYNAQTNWDGFIAKFSSTGNLIWLRAFSHASNRLQTGLDITGHSNGIYLSGVFILSYGGQVKKNSLPIRGCTLQGTAESTYFISKLDGEGNCIWAKSIEGRVSSFAALDVDALENVYINGNFKGTIKMDTFNLTSTTYRGSFTTNFFLAKINPEGKFIWVKGVGGGITDKSEDLYVDKSGNSYLTGSVFDTAYFDTIRVTATNTDYFVAKYDSSGKCLWALTRGSSNDNYGYTISADAEGNSYVGSNLRFITKYDKDGKWVWDLPLSGAVAKQSCTDSKGNLVIAGHLYDTVATFGDILLGNVSGGDFFVASARVSEPTAVSFPQEKQGDIRLYPNPASGSFFISMGEELQSQGLSIKVYNPLGGQVYECRYENCRGPLQVSLGERARGVYFVELLTGKGRVVKKLVLQ